VCAVDALFILIRFALYSRRRGPRHSLARTAREIRAARGMVNEPPRHEGAERLLSQDLNAYLLYIGIGIGVITQFPKLMAFSGGAGAIKWTLAWAWLYFGSWIVVELTYWIAWLDDGEDINPAQITALDRWIAPFEKAFGILAILSQLGILAAVDMKAIPPDPVIFQRWLFRGVRFAAHCAICVVHLPFLIISWKIDARQPVPPKYMGILLIFIIVPHVVSAGTQEKRFSSLYFMVSVMISYFSWMLYFFPWTKKWVLFCEPGGRIQPGYRAQVGHGREPQINIPRNAAEVEDKGWQNVLAFDFFSRIVVFSAFWYVVHYDPTGTTQPQWISYLP
jgi:hypothetical protein